MRAIPSSAPITARLATTAAEGAPAAVPNSTARMPSNAPDGDALDERGRDDEDPADPSLVCRDCRASCLRGQQAEPDSGTETDQPGHRQGTYADLPSVLSDPAANGLEGPVGLGEMEPIVAGHEPEGQAIALRAALPMTPDSLAVGDGHAGPQIEVRPAEYLEQGEQRGRVVVSLAEAVHPQILVVADDVRLILGDDPAITDRRDELPVDEMPEALEDRPFGRLGAQPEESTASSMSAVTSAGVAAWTSAGPSSPR